MKITTEHPASSYGIPVVLNDAGEVMDYAFGVQAVRHRLGLSTAGLATLCGRGRRTVEDWEQGRHLPPTESLLVMAKLLRENDRTRSQETRS